MFGPRNILLVLVIVVVLVAIFDRGERVPLAYSGGGLGILFVVLLVLWAMGWL